MLQLCWLNLETIVTEIILIFDSLMMHMYNVWLDNLHSNNSQWDDEPLDISGGVPDNPGWFAFWNNNLLAACFFNLFQSYLQLNLGWGSDRGYSFEIIFIIVYCHSQSELKTCHVALVAYGNSLVYSSAVCHVEIKDQQRATQRRATELK